MSSMNQNDDEIRLNGQEYEKKKSKLPKRIIFLLVIIILIIGACFAIQKIKNKANFGKDIAENVEDFVEEEIIGSEGEVSTISEAQIEEVFEISELQTADYIYNAVTEVYDEDGTTLKYHVAYEGTVTAGIDFDAIDINIDDENKTINIKVPEVTIQDAIVNAGLLEYIFEKKKYNTETVFKEAYDVCQKDLDNRAANETKLLDLAKENAKQVIEAMVKPWVEQVNSEYTVVIE